MTEIMEQNTLRVDVADDVFLKDNDKVDLEVKREDNRVRIAMSVLVCYFVFIAVVVVMRSAPLFLLDDLTLDQILSIGSHLISDVAPNLFSLVLLAVGYYMGGAENAANGN